MVEAHSKNCNDTGLQPGVEKLPVKFTFSLLFVPWTMTKDFPVKRQKILEIREIMPTKTP
jgi:hypothetical protein